LFFGKERKLEVLRDFLSSESNNTEYERSAPNKKFACSPRLFEFCHEDQAKFLRPERIFFVVKYREN
jgi:hypothetical protein